MYPMCTTTDFDKTIIQIYFYNIYHTSPFVTGSGRGLGIYFLICPKISSLAHNYIVFQQKQWKIGPPDNLTNSRPRQFWSRNLCSDGHDISVMKGKSQSCWIMLAVS